MGSLEAETGKHVNGGSFLLLIDYLALRILTENIVGKRLGIADGTGDAGSRRAALGTDDTRDLYLNAVCGNEGFLIKVEALTHIGPYVVDIIATFNGVCLIGLFKEIGGGEKLELHIKKLLVGEGVDLRGLVGAVHKILHLLLNILGVKHTEHIESHLAYLIIGVYDEHYLVVLGGPCTGNHLVLLIKDLLIVDHLGEYVKSHGHSAAKLQKLAHTGESIAKVSENGLHTDLDLTVLGKHLEIVIVCKLYIGNEVLDIVIVGVKILLERRKVVLNGRGHSAHHRTERIVNVDHSRILVILRAGYAGHCRKHSGHILNVKLKGKRIGGKSVLLNLRNEGVDTGGKRENKRNSYNTDTARKAGHKGTTLFSSKVFKRKRAGSPEGHLCLLRAAVHTRLKLLGGEATLSCLGSDLLLLPLVLNHILGSDGIGILDNGTVKYSDYSGGILLCKLGVVSYHNYKTLACNLTDKIHDLYRGVGVKRTRRLVRKKYLGIVYQCSCNGNSLTLTARKLIGSLVVLIGKTNLVKRRLGTGNSLLLLNAGNGERKLYVAKHRLVRNKVVALENKSYAMVAVNVPIAVAVGLGASSVDNEITRGVSVKTADDVKKRCLTAAGGTEDRNKLLVTEGNVNAAKCANRLRGGDVILLNVS